MEKDDLMVPDLLEVNDTIEEAQVLKDKIRNYQTVAGLIDDAVKDKSENYVPLDNLPYGEERIRLRDVPETLDHAIELLQSTMERKLTTEEVANNFAEATEIIEDANSIMRDCTPLPSEDDNEYQYQEVYDD